MWKHIKKTPEVINNISKKHWCWYSIAITVPTVWFSIVLPFWGQYFSLYINDQMTRRGNVISTIIVAPIAVVVLMNNWYASKSEKGAMEKLQGEVEYLGIINENVDKICDEKYEQLKNTIVEVDEGRAEVPEIVTKPTGQLKQIINGIKTCLVKFMESPSQKYSFKDFLVSIAYNFPLENDTWEWLDGMKEGDLSLAELLADGCTSTYNYLRSSDQPFYFNNKKEDAKKEHRYFYNKQDELNEELGEPVGSIYCCNFKIMKRNTTYVNAYLSISTNKKRFAVGNDEICNNTRENMNSLVRETFGKRIGIELCLLYLEHLGQP